MSHSKSPNTLELGFEKFVIRTQEGCWGWKGCAPKNPGYGQFRIKMKLERAHRASWLIHKGSIPHGMFVLHTCDNHICSNPDHLFLGTHLDNVRDMIKKERHPTLGKAGTNNIKAKLTEKEVKKIRELAQDKSLKLTQEMIGKMFNISQTNVGLIVRNVHWKGVS